MTRLVPPSKALHLAPEFFSLLFLFFFSSQQKAITQRNHATTVVASFLRTMSCHYLGLLTGALDLTVLETDIPWKEVPLPLGPLNQTIACFFALHCIALLCFTLRSRTEVMPSVVQLINYLIRPWCIIYAMEGCVRPVILPVPYGRTPLPSNSVPHFK
ncbi:hypothetical protein VTO42DRAFT_5753 [Malbranchea cinnamomea]